MIRGRRQALCLLALLCAALRVNPQEEAVPEPAAYVIRGIEYDIDGRTRDWALAHAAGLRLDESFPSLGSFNAFIERKKQALYNQRTLEETSLEYRFGEMEAGGLVPVYLTVKAKDSWNLIIFPEPKYDSNNAGSDPFPSGFSLTIKARDFNFLGTMTPLKLDAGYQQKEGKDYGTFLLDTGLPFQALGLHWFLDFDNELVFSPGEALSYRNITGLSVDLPAGRSNVAVGFNQSFIVNEEDEDDPVSLYFDDIWYLSSELYGVWKIPFGIDTGYGELYYAPELSLLANYRPGGDIGEYRSGPSVTPGHGLGFERIDWRGNFREGASVLFHNTNEYNTYHKSWERRFSVSAAIHHPFTSRFGVSARFMAQFWPDEPYKFAGDVLRGEKNNYLVAEKLVSLNLDFPFLLYRFLPAERYNRRALRFLEFEQHWAAFFDFGLFEGEYRREAGKDGKRKLYTTEPCSWADGLIITGGLEVITFPYRWRSVYLRISLGYNLLEMIRTRGGIKDEEKEIYIGLGHFY
ncbi:MAG: hypothetical protein LBB82_09225 [Treponema sp.]|nr:hypothetical protein [Treponema sp.]